jgi:hypothetical protein
MAPRAPRLPFNDRKHIPTRPEIDLLLGSEPSAELKRLESMIEYTEQHVTWSMQWYDNENGWGYRASYKERVLCVLHFFKGYYTATISIPFRREQEFLDLKDLTPAIRKQFLFYTPSPRTKWISFAIRKKQEVDAIIAILRLKLTDIQEKTVPRAKFRNVS